MFYQRLKKICDNRGITVTYLLKDLHISTSKGTAWKKGSSPNSEIVKKIANYFNVSTDYLLGNDNKKITPPSEDDEAMDAYSKFKKLDKDSKELIMKMMDKMIDD